MQYDVQSIDKVNQVFSALVSLQFLVSTQRVCDESKGIAFLAFIRILIQKTSQVLSVLALSKILKKYSMHRECKP